MSERGDRGPGHRTTDSDVIYAENKLVLRRYEPPTRTRETPILLVYALINRPYILDLQPDRSVVSRLLDAGFVVYLVDWGEPSRLDQSLTMADYVTRYLDNCVDAVCADAGVDRLHLLGYCMGGTMAAIYTARFQHRVRTLSVLAAPVSLDGTGGALECWLAGLDPDVLVETLGNVPAESLAVTFALLEPVENTLGKLVALWENIDDDEFVALFVRMERWIWDGVDVAGETYRDFVTDIYRNNELIDGEFVLDGERIDLGDIEVPVLAIVGESDTLVPPDASRPLLDRVGSDDTRLIEFPSGHVGLAVSGAAHDRLWPAVCEWVADRERTRVIGQGTGE
jgi:polyhydroxyalkanoate synthase